MFSGRIKQSWLLLVIFLLSPSFVSAEPNAADFEAAVLALQRDKVIDVPKNGNIRLFDNLNRAEALKVIMKSQDRYSAQVKKVSEKMPKLALFSDVNQKAWFAPYVEIAFKNKLITGYPDGLLRPQAAVKTGEAAVMLARSFNVTRVPFQMSADLINKSGQWYTDAFSWLIEKGAIKKGSGLEAGAYLTRGEFFDMVHRLRRSLAADEAGSAASIPADDTAEVSDKPFAISIPSLGIIDLTVTHPDDPFSDKGLLVPLSDGVGHLFGYPGEGTLVMIYGHSSGYPWDLSEYTKIFRKINKAEPGSRVYVTYKGKLFVYEVTSKGAVSAGDRKPFEPDDNGEELILYTCWPPDTIDLRFLVHAKSVRSL